MLIAAASSKSNLPRIDARPYRRVLQLSNKQEKRVFR
jgi:hypothetical protein